MLIQIQLSREDNRELTLDFEEYVACVVASEIGNAPIEACKAQAVAARTTAMPYVIDGKTILDTNIQAFKPERLRSTSYPNATAAAQCTKDEVLYYSGKLISPCSFSASNGGKTTSSEKRWGGYRPYLIEQDDPWDMVATHGKKTGHGVGMSQKGAIYAASQGFTYDQILSFYYPGTSIHKEGSLMATVKASDLVKIFKQMASEKWKYVAGAHKTGEVDCSGAFYYAYKQLGGYMYHGSNTMWRKYTTEKGKIGEVDLVPGMAVFKVRNWSSEHSSNSWYNSDPGDVYHVGLYIGDNTVVEAKSTKYGVVTSDISTWKYAAKLKDTSYDVVIIPPNVEQPMFGTRMGVVKIGSGWLNLRKAKDVNSERMGKLYNGDVLTIIGEDSDWYTILHEKKTVYAKKNFIALVDQGKKQYTLTITVFGDDELERMKANMLSDGYKPTVIEGCAAA